LEVAEGLRLSVDEEVALHRAQGGVWAVLSESPELRAALEREYERVRSLLPTTVDLGK